VVQDFLWLLPPLASVLIGLFFTFILQEYLFQTNFIGRFKGCCRFAEPHRLLPGIFRRPEKAIVDSSSLFVGVRKLLRIQLRE
jgi:hypothetical protein